MRITMTDWIHRVLDEYIKEGDCCIDATMGKGGDTYYLCSKTGESGKEMAVSCIMFNLGYLPGGDHHLATKTNTTIQAVEAGLGMLKTGGIMSICIYSGGDSGFEERDGVLEYLSQLDDRKYFIARQDFPNKKNNPPMPVFIIKL